MSHDLNYLRWRDQTRRDLSRTFGILALLAVIVWTATSISAEGAATLPTHATPTTPTPATTSIWLTVGSSGDDVTTVQTILAHHGWSVKIDGDYGPITEAIVTRFQAASGLYVDGIVGPVTWGALQGVKRGPSIQVGTPPPPTWGEPIPRYSNHGICTSAEASIIARTFAAAGASTDTIRWALLVASRESGCDETAHNRSARTRDDSFGVFQLNARSGHFGPGGILAGFDRWALLTDFELNARAATTLWQTCGRGPWSPPYSCSEPTS